MGCAASTSANAVVPFEQQRVVDPGTGQKTHASCGEEKQAAASQSVPGQTSVADDSMVSTGKDDVVMIEPTDEERSKNTTPASNDHAQGLGATTPRSSQDSQELGLAASPLSAKGIQHLPPSLEPLPAPTDVDSIALPAAKEEESLVPYWEKEPLPARPGTSSRRPQSSGGKKLVVYKTEKTKKLEAEAKKKRGDDVNPSPEKTLSSKTARSSLPPIKLRQKVKPHSENFEVMTPAKKGNEWTGSSGGEAWSVQMPAAPKKEPLMADIETTRTGCVKTKGAEVMAMDTPECSPLRTGSSAADVFTVER